MQNRVCLVKGTPGSGKTMLAFQFLLAGRDAGERLMYITLSESADELRTTALSHKLNLSNCEIVELIASTDELDIDKPMSMYQPLRSRAWKYDEVDARSLHGILTESSSGRFAH